MKQPVNWARKKPKTVIDARPLTAARDARKKPKTLGPIRFEIPAAVQRLKNDWDREIARFDEDLRQVARRFCDEIEVWFQSRSTIRQPNLSWSIA